ncbi:MULTISPECIES: sugar ABC transporter permease [Winkia]|uniref:carbohydrate ABC transporter permease n=1 Tax=Winkia TaxID=2692118 RepID=UPI0023AA05B1|nr:MULTISPECIES: sugar ABC transporter permease [Winkia]MDK7163897.1 sugar ABC transporter permease [Winkia sp. UMB3105]MDK8595043.1 sugar ABC transporter permease [Winkia sp. UMB1096A]MDU2269996.1 sugar ABC transporter permease [Winkia neuii]MDU5161770.1 sugar ABC transporter permease [Winkia neuii]WEB56311.1 sugar ABC transporter permease [Winkia neuii]
MKTHKWFTPYLLVGPAALWVVVFSLWPFLNTVVLSFTNAKPLRAYKFVGLQNYLELFHDPHFGAAILVSIVYVLVCVPLLTILPLLLAVLVRKKIPGIGFFRTSYYFPVVASVVVVGIIWAWMFNSRGIVNEALKMAGLIDQPINFMIDRWKLLACAILLTVWKGLGYYMVVYLAALANASKDVYEAATLDGAGWWHRFRSVTIPAVRGAMLLVSALVCVSAIRVFSELYILSNGTGGPGGKDQSIVMLIQRTGSGLNGNLGYASALSIALFFLTVGPLLLVAYLNYGKDALKNSKKRSKAKVQSK